MNKTTIQERAEQFAQTWDGTAYRHFAEECYIAAATEQEAVDKGHLHKGITDLEDKKQLWILEKDFSQDWHINLECVECYIRGKNRDQTEQCEYYDKQMTDVIGSEPADYGYIVLCPDDRNDDSIVLGCKTEEDYRRTYFRICLAIMEHPHCIDLRGIDLIFG